ncbi:MAG: NAD-dependent epimerase/dehydratase family protein [Atopobiaceae bacterium]|nr:NAD-dependent epimerase/dehydratase family protein [Atopobiaceae bacterium]
MKFPRYRNEVIQEDLEHIFSSPAIDWERFRDKTVLVTGAYGMLASYLVYALCYASEKLNGSLKIVALGRSEKKARARFDGLLDMPFLEFHIADVSEPLPAGLPPAQYVIHAASPASSQYYDIIPAEVFLANAIGTLNTLRFAQGCNAERYLLFSSGEVYGKVTGEYTFEDDFGPLDSMDVRSCYGEGKRAAENLCASWAHEFHLDTVAVRPSHTYGPTMDIEKDQRVFAEFVGNAVRREDILVKGNPNAQRSFCYLSDATTAYLKVLLDGIPGSAYNVASVNGNITIGELARLVVSLSKGSNVSFGVHETGYLESPTLVHPQLATDRLQKLGVSCAVSPREGFARTIRSFELENTR